MVTFPNMSAESFPSQDREIYRSFNPEDGVDVKHDPKGPALQTIHDFLGLTPRVILEGPVQNLPNLKEIVTFGSESERELFPNQRLARSMLGLEQALTTLRQNEPPLENGEELRSEWSHIDGETGELTTMEFYCGKAGSDFGTFVSCRINPDIDTNPTNGSYWHLTLPSNHYLMETLRWGTPHEPVFFASEPDIYSPEWSDKGEEWLENGGLAKRHLDFWKACNIVDNTEPRDVFQPDMVVYQPLYDRYNAGGIEKYVEITQKLLKMFLQSVSERDSRPQL
jgi:hypothetical protein